LGIFEQNIQGVEKLVGDGGGLFGKSEIEERILFGSAANHYLIDILD
jgi:hypothetical protein